MARGACDIHYSSELHNKGAYVYTPVGPGMQSVLYVDKMKTYKLKASTSKDALIFLLLLTLVCPHIVKSSSVGLDSKEKAIRLD